MKLFTEARLETVSNRLEWLNIAHPKILSVVPRREWMIKYKQHKLTRAPSVLGWSIPQKQPLLGNKSTLSQFTNIISTNLETSYFSPLWRSLRNKPWRPRLWDSLIALVKIWIVICYKLVLSTIQTNSVTRPFELNDGDFTSEVRTQTLQQAKRI